MAERAWRYLEVSLDRYDLGLSGQAVVDRMLEMDRTYALPEWLVARQVARSPEHLLQTLLRHRLVDDAVEAGRRVLVAVEKQKVRGGPAYTPYTVFDQILAVDSKASNEFRREVEQHIKLAA